MMLMLIAPGDEMDRTWINVAPANGVVIYETFRFGADPLDSATDSPPKMAYVRWFYLPGWRIKLAFLMRDHSVPRRYVMPGWVEGELVELVPVCTVCYAHQSRVHWAGPLSFTERQEYDRANCWRAGQARHIRLFRTQPGHDCTVPGCTGSQPLMWVPTEAEVRAEMGPRRPVFDILPRSARPDIQTLTIRPTGGHIHWPVP